MFCPNCNALMFPSEGEMVCRRCGAKLDQDGGKHVITERNKEEKGLTIIEEEAETLPKARAECPKCGNGEAFWVLRQMRGSDEPETRIFQCTKCKNKWREN